MSYFPFKGCPTQMMHSERRCCALVNNAEYLYHPKIPISVGNTNPISCIMQGSLGPHKFTPRTAYRLVQPFFSEAHDRDQHTDKRIRTDGQTAEHIRNNRSRLTKKPFSTVSVMSMTAPVMMPTGQRAKQRDASQKQFVVQNRGCGRLSVDS